MGNCVSRFDLVREKYDYDKGGAIEIFQKIEISDRDFEIIERVPDTKFEEIFEYVDEIICSEGWELYRENEILVRTMHVKFT
jgi:hypothetical protein